MFEYKDERANKEKTEEVAHIRAEAKTVPIVANQSTANWYNCRDRRRETKDLSVQQRHTHKTEGKEGALR